MRTALATAGSALLMAGATTVGVVATASPSYACDAPARTLKQDVKRADAIFLGVVSGKEEQATRIVHKVRVLKVFKGGIDSTPVTVKTRRNSCGISAEPGERWVFFAEPAGDAWTVSLVGGTTPASEMLLQRLPDLTGEEPTVPEVSPPDEPAPLDYTSADPPPAYPLTRLLAPGAAVALLGGLGWVAARRLGRR